MGLLISEDFYSVQGEGFETGYPAYFIRLKGCNLSCGASPKDLSNVIKAGKDNTDSGSFKGELHAKGGATWTCDTIPVWLFGQERDNSYLIDRWKDQNILKDIEKRNIHLIWTGGEPTMPIHQRAIVDFLESINFHPYNELETNGTVLIGDGLYDYIDRVNCSPKLSNSGMTLDRRRNLDVIDQVIHHPGGTFKFVISNEEDIEEMFLDFIDPCGIPISQVCCMPGLDDQKDFHERTRFVMEMSKKYKFRGLTRLHVSAWDKTTGV